MGTRVVNIGRAILVLVLIPGIIVGLGFGLRALVRWFFHGVDPSVAAAIVAGVFTAVGSVAAILLQRRTEKRKALEEQIRVSKTPLYTSLVELIMRTVHSFDSRAPQSQSQEQINEEFKVGIRELTPGLLLWASEDVIVGWADFSRRTPAGDEGVFALEKFIATIRRDFGHQDSKFKDGDLLSLFISDVDEYLAQRVAN
jgi:hypothetical protein